MSSIKNFIKYLLPKYQKLIMDYPVQFKPRLAKGNPYFELLNSILSDFDKNYKKLLESFLHYKDQLIQIKENKNTIDSNQPGWNNGFLPGLDIITLYGIISNINPKHYLEIGSGNSTKVARKAIKDQNLQTRIISIDPYPRAEIDNLSDEIIRLPVENINIDIEILSKLDSGDILFIDNSHRVLPNSDSLTCFTEILPFLKKGVIVHIHDIYLPYDYPQDMCDRFYNEQYFLALLISNNVQRYKPVLPNYYIYKNQELLNILNPIFDNENLKNVEKHGGSFWIEIN